MPNSITTQNTSKITNIYQLYNLLFLTIDIELEIKIIQDEEIGKNNTNFLAVLFLPNQALITTE